MANCTNKSVQVIREGQENPILHEFHTAGIGGHCGINKTIDAIKIRYWWPGLTDDVKRYVSNHFFLNYVVVL